MPTAAAPILYHTEKLPSKVWENYLQSLGTRRWLAVDNASASAVNISPSRDAGASQQQPSSTGMADPSRWLSQEGLNTLKWQVCSLSVVHPQSCSASRINAVDSIPFYLQPLLQYTDADCAAKPLSLH